MVAYYADGVHDCTDVAIRVNGTLEKGEYEAQVADDSLLLLFVCTIRARSFSNKILCKIMGDDYLESSARVVACGTTQGLKFSTRGYRRRMASTGASRR